MKKGIKKAISTIAILTMTFQMGMPIIPAFTSKVFATDMTIPVEAENIQVTADEEGITEASESIDTTQPEEISRNYEIKKEESWDISANGDGSVIAKWTLKDRTLTISGTGEMKDWGWTDQGDWHTIQYIDSIKRIIIENGITNIGNSAFEYCTSLTTVTIPESVINIGYNAFTECSSLKNIEIPEKVISIGRYALAGCTSLESINVAANNKNYLSIDGVLFSKDKTQIIQYPSAKSDAKEYAIPNTVISIEEYAFYQCNNLASITIPEGITSIENGTFYGCTSLTNITIPEGVTIIGESAFEYCTSLASISIPESVEIIEGRVFNGCSSLESITLPERITNIEEETFERCSSLTNITIPKAVTIIEEYAFAECTSLTSINIPSSIRTIEKDAISNTTIIYAKLNTEGHRYAEENKQGYILTYETGDIDGNEMIEITDFLMLKRHLVAGNRTNWILTENSLLAADINEDGSVDITDMLMLKRVVVENI